MVKKRYSSACSWTLTSLVFLMPAAKVVAAAMSLKARRAGNAGWILGPKSVAHPQSYSMMAVVVVLSKGCLRRPSDES
jgi:hypothetical protein